MRAFKRFLPILFTCGFVASPISCYRLSATEGGAPTVGRELVLELSERGGIELAPQLGPQLKSVTGRVSDFRDNAYRVAVTQTDSRTGVETLWRGEEASIPREFVLTVAERQLDKRRTWIVVGLSALGVALAGKAFGIDYGLNGFFGGGGGGGRQ